MPINGNLLHRWDELMFQNVPYGIWNKNSAMKKQGNLHCAY